MTSKLANAMATGQATQVGPYERFHGQVQRLRPEIAGLCGKDNVDRFVRVCLNAAQSNPDVLTADRKTLLLACLKAAQDNLLPDGREAVFNIYNTDVPDGQGGKKKAKVVQYMPMSFGLIQKIYEAGATYVDGVAVYEKDEFDFQRGDDPKIVHKPFKGEGEPGPVVAAYIVVKLKTGETKREVMFRRDIEKVRAKSKQPEGLMWGQFYDQGAIKSVVHRISKQLPRADVLDRALGHDNEVVGLAEVEAPRADGGLDRIIETLPIEAPREEKVIQSETKKVGTPELKAAYLEMFSSIDNMDTLNLKMDEARGHEWLREELALIEAAYKTRVNELNAKKK